jgi:hypothetical protein
MSFQEVLDKRSADIKPLPPIPQGEYHAVVKGHPSFNPVGANQTPAVNFTLTGFRPYSHIEPAALAECGDLAERELTLTLFLTDAALLRLKRFLDHLGIDEGDRTLRERIADAPNRAVIVTITHTMSKTSNQIFANISSTAKAG